MLTAEERADAEHRVKNLNARMRAAIEQLALADEQKITLEGQKAYNKTWEALEDNGWIRSTANGYTGADQVTIVQFTMDGWLALDILYPDDE